MPSIYLPNYHFKELEDLSANLVVHEYFGLHVSYFNDSQPDKIVKFVTCTCCKGELDNDNYNVRKFVHEDDCLIPRIKTLITELYILSEGD